MSHTTFSVNGREYIHQGDPVVVICIDGSEPAYHEEAIKAGRMPWLKSRLKAAAPPGAHTAPFRRSPTRTTCPLPQVIHRQCMASAALTSWTRPPAKRF